MNLPCSDREEAVRRHSGLVMGIARKFSGRAEVTDLYQAGCIGLLRALNGYDPSRGFAFSTYAVPIIISEIRSYLRGSGPVHIPRPVRELATKCLAAQDALRAELSREPTVAEISLKIGASPADVAYAMESTAVTSSIFEPASGGSGGQYRGTRGHYGAPLNLIDVIIGFPSHESSVCESVTLSRAIARLPELQRSVVIMRFFEERTQVEVAATLGISQPQVHRIEKAALSALRCDSSAE